MTAVERTVRWREKRRHLRNLLLLASPLSAVDVSMIELTFADPVPDGGSMRKGFHSWAKFMLDAGLITWAIAVRHDKGNRGGKARAHLHVMCDLHPDVAQLLRSYQKSRSAKYRQWSKVKLNEFGVRLADVGARIGAGSRTHWRLVDEGGPGYLLGPQWDRKKPWIFGVDIVNTFVPQHDSPEERHILAAMRVAGDDKKAVKVALVLLRELREAECSPVTARQYADPKPLPPSRAGQRLAALTSPDGVLGSMLRDQFHVTHWKADRSWFFDRYAGVLSRTVAWDAVQDHSHRHSMKPPSRQDFIAAMDDLFDSGGGYWLGVTLADDPVTVQDLWPRGERMPVGNPAPLPPLAVCSVVDGCGGFHHSTDSPCPT